MEVKAIKTRVFKEGESLFDFVVEHLSALESGDILAVTSKIVSLAENRVSTKSREEIIKEESDFYVQGGKSTITVVNNEIMATAGVDASNADGKLILLPKNSFETADKLRHRLIEKFKLNQLGIIITDSRTIPFRAGAIGKTIGYAGLRGLKKYAGTPDIFGRKIKRSRQNVADMLASAAILEMSEAAEQKPLAIIKNYQAEFTDKVDPDELKIAFENELYRPMFTEIDKRFPLNR
ncbi:coenzyme F420-0:L-glutamate ligase [Candidatus Berkelbacteria bacterium]|nr:coenzyme F420-0:L-glutamate ligase [Candidatus Berkelbacteria bacterium]